jgi:hypothetical protein
MARRLESPCAIRRVRPKERKHYVVDIEEDTKFHKPDGLFQLLKKNAMEFCCSTSLHGLQYVGEKQRHISERQVSVVKAVVFCVQDRVKYKSID